ncbi:GTPase-activator protein for ras-like GTPase domain-containing protein [Hirsutella rhossiliensis]|uniref:GTPase-activator protein for ras-like GTPase domain-containing protein n=1 Tax=Hirsutella rhossiliensis TaxID=111463 RepID=A0A9P8MRU0_9HYPO|nr:GTPase-activator protein for ras-like GTPase domain-containing protein [Hirsutella rhossiliensis]KAH0958062.1 GTPase-activator protein for ras-like GTPase domain-containing protein [Hirsutella rhossiliensis]
MEGQASATLSESGGSEATIWPRQHQRQQPSQPRGHPPQVPGRHSSSPLELRRNPAASLARPAFRYNADSSGTPQAVAPDFAEGRRFGAAAFSQGSAASPLPIPRDAGSPSQQGSPMAIFGGGRRRQGVVFGDSLAQAQQQQQQQQYQRYQHIRASGSTRPRTRTMDAGLLTHRGAPPVPDRQRHRIGSVSSSGSQPMPHDEPQKSTPPTTMSDSDPVGYPPMPAHRHTETLAPSSKTKEKKSASSNRRLLRRLSSRPSSPEAPAMASVDSLSIPVATGEPARIISLMKALAGRMRGEIECEVDAGGTWYAGFAYIDDDNGCLMCHSGHQGTSMSAFTTLVPDLRGCRVLPVEYPESGKACLEVVALQKQHSGEAIIVLLRPLASDDWNLWLAALLCWQQIQPAGMRMANGNNSPSSTTTTNSYPTVTQRPGLRRQGQSASSLDGGRSSNIIKVGTVMLWDKGPVATPWEVVHRPSTRDKRSPPVASWRKVSCILHEDGEFRLLMENDISVLCVIQLSKLSRHSIQQLDHTVLDQEFCIAIFPIYAQSSTQLSIFRPVYLALDSRVAFEVWFVLLRAIAVPEIHKLDGSDNEYSAQGLTELESEQDEETFRIERTVGVRVTEAKIRARQAAEPESTAPERAGKSEQADPLVGSYLAEVILDGEVRARTTTRTDTKNPFWREDCEFVDLPPSVRDLTIVLKRLVETSADDGGTAQEELVCGSVNIILDRLERGKDHEEWLQILDDRQQPIGSMLVKIWHAEHVALLTKEYRPLSDLLHRFSTGLTTMISAALPGQLRRLSETFLDIFQASGSASDWLMALVEDEIDGIGSEANLLFRGNTLLTQSLEFHMRRLGTEYLDEVLRDKIVELNELDPDCEVDPSRLPHLQHYHHHHHAVAADMDQRWNRLILLTTEVWHRVADSADRLPAELRQILKYIRAVAEDRYGDFLRTVKYTAVSGFLFLRFICPAILSPKLFGLLRDHPRPRAQRTLTLIAKVLQKMSNMSVFGKREEWMEPMNKFLSAQRPIFREYIDRVCGIPTERDGVRSVPASYSTPVTMLGRLGPAAREGFPSLPYLIDQARSFASLVKLWVDSCPPDVKRGQIFDDGELLATFHDLCNALQRRSDACLARAEHSRAIDSVSGGAEQLAESLEQATLIESLSNPHSLAVAIDAIRPPGSSGSDGLGDRFAAQRHSKEYRAGREASSLESKKTGSTGGGGNTIKGRNGKVGRTILSGIMRIGGRAESPDSKQQK